MTFKEFDKLVRRYIQGECTPEEAERIEKWYASYDQKEIKDSISVQRKISIEKRLLHALQEREKIPARQKFLTLPYLSGMAAGVLLLIISVMLLDNKTGTLINPAETTANIKTRVVVNTGTQEKLLVLEDSSTILLQPGSEVIYASQRFSENREVSLSGEAFFKIKKDSHHPFLVYSGGLVTKVLGTSFNISALKNSKEVIVSVKTGKVSVFTSKEYNQQKIKQTFVLTTNQLAIYDPHADMVVKGEMKSDNEATKSRRTTPVHFANVPVHEIFKTFQDTYGIEIRFDNETLSSCTITTTMANESLFEKLDIICQAIGARYEIIDASIVIHGAGCN